MHDETTYRESEVEISDSTAVEVPSHSMEGSSCAPPTGRGEGGSDHSQVVRMVSRPKLVWEMMDVSQALPVRHGVRLAQHTVFVETPDENSRTNWVAAHDERLSRYLRKMSYERLGRGASESYVDEVIAHIEARGFGRPVEPIARRMHWDGANLWVCLGPNSQRAVRINKSGWNMDDSPPVIFMPGDSADSLPEPQPGGSLHWLRRFFPNVSDENWPALLGFLVAMYLPNGPFPALCLHGPQGSGKSMATELIRGLGDPVIGQDARTAMPKSPEDLFTLAANSHMLTLDNLSRIRNDMSDALCVLLTGSTFQSRRLYTQGDCHALRARVPVIMNGITASPEREDLLSRCVSLDLMEIPSGAVRTEAAIWDDYRRIRPKILGALFDAVSMAIRDMEATVVTPSHRLTDAARFVSAAEPAIGLPDGYIVSAWLATQAGAQEDLSGTDPVVELLHKRMGEEGTDVFKGTAAELCRIAIEYEREGYKLPTDFPREAARLGEHLKRRSTVIRRAGFEVKRRRSNSSRELEITWVKPTPLQSMVSVQRPKAVVAPPSVLQGEEVPSDQAA